MKVLKERSQLKIIELESDEAEEKKKINPPKTLYYHNQKRDKLKTGRAEIFTYESHWFKKYDFFFFFKLCGSSDPGRIQNVKNRRFRQR